MVTFFLTFSGIKEKTSGWTKFLKCPLYYRGYCSELNTTLPNL
jgi:hypothetical protein